MDKFIIRTPRTEPRPAPAVQPVKKLKQMTLEGLKGVVVLEDLERAKLVLCRPDSTTGDLLQQLGLLAKKTPTKSILDSTGIGEVVSALRGAPDPAVAAEAKRVHKIWKRHNKLKKNRPIIEAVFDLRTQKVRNSARNLIKEALQSNLTAPESSSGRKKHIDSESLSMDERYMSDLGTVVSTTSLGYSKGIRIDLDRYENAMSDLQQGKPGADVSTGGNKSDLQGKHGAKVSTENNKGDLQEVILADELSLEDHEKVLTSASSALDSGKKINVDVNLDVQGNSDCFDKKYARQLEKKRKLDNVDEPSRPKKFKLECRTTAADKTIMSDRQLLTDSSGIKNDEYPGTETENYFPELSLSVAESRAREKERPKKKQASNDKNHSKENRGLNDDPFTKTQTSNDKHSKENRASKDNHSKENRHFNDNHCKEDRASNDKHSNENIASNKNGYKKERNCSSHSQNANSRGLHSNLKEGHPSKCPSIGNPKPMLVQPSELEATSISLNEKSLPSKLNDKHQTDSPADSRQKDCCFSMEKKDSDVLHNKCLNEKSMPTSHFDVVHHRTNPSSRESKSSVNSTELATSASVKTSNTEQINAKENTSPRTKHSSSSARSNDEITLHEDTSSKSFVPVNIDLDILSEAIERELFFENQRLINKSYRKTIRRLVFTLKHQDRVRRRVLRGRYSAAKIVSQCWQE